MSNPLYARDIATGLNHELDAEEDAPGLWALRVAASLSAHANIDSALNIAPLNNLAVYRQDKYRDDVYMDTVTVGTGTAVYEGVNGGVKMAVTNNGDAVIRQSKQYHTYFSGSPQFYELTTINMAPQTGVVKRIGGFSTLGSVSPYDTNRDGLYMESSNGVLSFKVDKGGVNIFSAEQSTWDDPLDGSGTSRLTMAPESFEALAIEYLYLGGTVARFGFLIGPGIVWAHTFRNSNVLLSTMLRSPVQPLRYEIRSTGGAGSVYQVCARVGTKGSSIANPNELDYEPASAVNANTIGTVYALCGVKLTDPRGHVEISAAYALAITNDRFSFSLRLNPVVAGTFTYNAVAGTSYAVALGDAVGNPSANTVTNGTLVTRRTVQQGGNSVIARDNRNLHLGSKIDGTSDTLVLCCTPLSINLDIIGGFTVRELP